MVAPTLDDRERPFDEDRVLREHLATFGGDVLRESWRACSTGPQPYRDAMLREMVTRPDLADLTQLIGMADHGWPAASVGGQDETIWRVDDGDSLALRHERSMSARGLNPSAIGTSARNERVPGGLLDNLLRWTSRSRSGGSRARLCHVLAERSTRPGGF